jgi:hypothetical protein
MVLIGFLFVFAEDPDDYDIQIADQGGKALSLPMEEKKVCGAFMFFLQFYL